MGNLKYVEENLKRDDLSGIIMHFSLVIFSYSFAGKEMNLISVCFPRLLQRSKKEASVFWVHSRG